MVYIHWFRHISYILLKILARKNGIYRSHEKMSNFNDELGFEGHKIYVSVLYISEVMFVSSNMARYLCVPIHCSSHILFILLKILACKNIICHQKM